MSYAELKTMLFDTVGNINCPTKKKGTKIGYTHRVELRGNHFDLYSADTSFESRQILQLSSLTIPYFYSVHRDKFPDEKPRTKYELLFSRSFEAHGQSSFAHISAP